MTTLQGPGPRQTAQRGGPGRHRTPPRPRLVALVCVTALAAVLVPLAVVAGLHRTADSAELVPAPGDVDATPSAVAVPPSIPEVPATTTPQRSPAATGGGVGTGPPGPPARGWTLVAQDTFDGGSLDEDHWFRYTGRTAGGVGQHLASNVSVGGGAMTITSRADTSGGVSWVKGQKYGRWEVRARADRATGYGPVLLLWPDAENWPVGGEIDFMEIPGPDRTASRFTVHYGADDSTAHGSAEGDFTQWTTFAVEWTPTSVTGYVNGREIFRTTDPQAMPPGPMHLAIQQDVGPFGDDWIPARDATTPAAARLQIDWIRIYRM